MTTATAERIVGCETPRLFTPPLPENCNKHGVLKRSRTHGYQAIKFAEDCLHLSLYPWQKWMLIHGLELVPDENGYDVYRFRTVILEVGRQNGKALDVDTPILTTAGWIRMGDIESGDFVYDPSGQPTRVLVAHDVQYDRECFEVETTDGRSVVADADHLWTVRDRRHRRGREWETLTTREIFDRGVFRREGPRHNDYAFRLPDAHAVMSTDVDLPIDPYVLGVWLGDGTSRSAVVSMGEHDQRSMCMNLRQAGARIKWKKHDPTCVSVCIDYGTPVVRNGKRCNRFRDDLKRIGLLGNKHVPSQYLTAGTDQRRALLAGLLDTDGTISRRGQVEFCSTNLNIAESVLYLARSLGYRTTMKPHVARIYGRDCGAKYRVCFTPSDNVFRLDRKSARINILDSSRRHAVGIRSVRPVSSRPVRCITVDNPHGLYLAGIGLIPTHNTVLATVLILYHMFILHSRTVIGTAQDLSKADDTWRDVVAMAESDDELSEMFVAEDIYKGHPKSFTLLDGCEYRVASASRRGGRGFSGDLIVLDELREHTNWDSWSAVKNTMNARPRAQAWCFSNAGDATSVVLRYQRAIAHRDLEWPDGEQEFEGVLDTVDDAEVAELLRDSADLKPGWFEYSAPPGAKRNDLHALAQSNPSLNHSEVSLDCPTTRTLLSALADCPSYEYETEVMCRWATVGIGGPFPGGSWEATCDANARPGSATKRIVCVEVSSRRSQGYIARAGAMDDGTIVVGIRYDHPGTDWIVEALLRDRHAIDAIVVRSDAGATTLAVLEDIRRRVDVRIIDWKSSDLNTAHQRMFDRLRDRQVKHLPHAGLDMAATSAIPIMKPGGGFVVDIKRSPTDTAALYAAIGAVWGAENLSATTYNPLDSVR